MRYFLLLLFIIATPLLSNNTLQEHRFTGFSPGLTLTLGHQSFEYKKELDSSEFQLEHSTGNLGIALEGSYYISPSLGLFTKLSAIRGNQSNIKVVFDGYNSEGGKVAINQLSLLIGARFNLGDPTSGGNIFYLSGGLGLTKVTLNDDSSEDFECKGYLFTLEGGINIPQQTTTIDLFITLSHTRLSDFMEELAGGDSGSFQESSLSGITLGGRLNF